MSNLEVSIHYSSNYPDDKKTLALLNIYDSITQNINTDGVLEIRVFQNKEMKDNNEIECLILNAHKYLLN